jgi:hypothetical protein
MGKENEFERMIWSMAENLKQKIEETGQYKDLRVIDCRVWSQDNCCGSYGAAVIQDKNKVLHELEIRRNPWCIVVPDKYKGKGTYEILGNQPMAVLSENSLEISYIYYDDIEQICNHLVKEYDKRTSRIDRGIGQHVQVDGNCMSIHLDIPLNHLEKDIKMNKMPGLHLITESSFKKIIWEMLSMSSIT